MRLHFTWIIATTLFGPALGCLAAIPATDPPDVGVIRLVEGLNGKTRDELVDLGLLDNRGRLGALTKQLERAREMDELVKSLADFRIAHPGPWNEIDAQTRKRIDDFRPLQFVRVENLKHALTEADRAASQASDDGRWGAWLALSRSCLRLAASVPQVADVLPVQEAECDKLMKLRRETDEALRRRYAEAMRFRGQRTESLGAEGQVIAEARKAAAEYGDSLHRWISGMEEDRKQRASAQPFIARWRAWMLAEKNTSGPPLPHDLGPVWARLGAPTKLLPAGELDADGILLRDVRLLIPWPYFLAEALDLGEIYLRHEAFGFEWTEDSRREAPAIRPRIRVRVEFRVRKEARPEAFGQAPIVAYDHRFLGKPLLLYPTPPQPNQPAPVPPPRFTADLATKISLLPAEEQARLLGPEPKPECWFLELNTGWPGNKAVQKVVGDYARLEDRLDTKWSEQFMPASFPDGLWDDRLTRELYPFDASTSDLDSIMSLIATAAGAASSALDIEAAPLEVVDAADRARTAFQKAGFSANRIRLPEAILAAHARRRTFLDRTEVAAMLPLPLPPAGVIVHPWPEADHAWNRIDWSPDLRWLAESRETLEDRFETLGVGDSERIGFPTRAVGDIARELERRLAGPLQLSDRPVGLGDWRPSWTNRADPAGEVEREIATLKWPLPPDVSVRARDLASVRIAIARLNQVDGELASLKEDVGRLRRVSLELCWLCNIRNTMLDPHVTFERRFKKPAKPPELPPMDADTTPDWVAWGNSVKGLIDNQGSEALRTLFDRVQDRSLQIREGIEQSRSCVEVVVVKYPRPSGEAQYVEREVINRCSQISLALSSIENEIRLVTNSDLFSTEQVKLRAAASAVAKIAPGSQSEFPIQVQFSDFSKAEARRVPRDLVGSIQSDRIDRAAIRWLRSRPGLEVELSDAGRIALAFLKRARQLDIFYRLEGSFARDEIPGDYALFRSWLDPSLKDPKGPFISYAEAPSISLSFQRKLEATRTAVVEAVVAAERANLVETTISPPPILDILINGRADDKQAIVDHTGVSPEVFGAWFTHQIKSQNAEGMPIIAVKDVRILQPTKGLKSYFDRRAAIFGGEIEAVRKGLPSPAPVPDPNQDGRPIPPSVQDRLNKARRAVAEMVVAADAAGLVESTIDPPPILDLLIDGRATDACDLTAKPKRGVTPEVFGAWACGYGKPSFLPAIKFEVDVRIVPPAKGLMEYFHRKALIFEPLFERARNTMK